MKCHLTYFRLALLSLSPFFINENLVSQLIAGVLVFLALFARNPGEQTVIRPTGQVTSRKATVFSREDVEFEIEKSQLLLVQDVDVSVNHFDTYFFRVMLSPPEAGTEILIADNLNEERCLRIYEAIYERHQITHRVMTIQEISEKMEEKIRKFQSSR